MRERCWIVESVRTGLGVASPPVAIWDGTPSTAALLEAARSDDGWVVRGPYVLESDEDVVA